MNDLPAVSWINLALQIPLALVIVFLVIKFLSFVKDIIEKFLGHMATQQELNRQQMKESLTRLAEEIKGDRMETIKEVANLTERVDAVLDKMIFGERLAPPNHGRKAKDE